LVERKVRRLELNADQLGVSVEDGNLQGGRVGLTDEKLRAEMDALAAKDPQVARELARIGYPAARLRDRGFRMLLRTIVGQQVSVAAASSMWNRLEAELGADFTPTCLLERDFDTLRACGLSRQKQGYARSLCELVEGGELDLHALPGDDEEAIAALTRIKGIGRWSAEIYLLFAEGRTDIWPAGDLAVQECVRRLLEMEERPKEKQTREIGARWSPHRGAMAIFTWHFYANPAL
jgi:DNA-3-methyladenine glycosylase II